jgi:hypothetical protein
MRKVKFEGIELNVPGILTIEQIQNHLKERYPSLAKATAAVDADTGDVTFKAAAGDKE